ncbi:hypothetical protein E8E11_008499 [Didymella keratinophila]|nr:hypothetical protein E8E11_008499 [Didymella keratinophila]
MRTKKARIGDQTMKDKPINWISVLNGELNLAPIPKNPIDFADKYPSAEICATCDEVLGTDLSPTQPLLIPSNLHFEVDDLTEPWMFRKPSFDFIHARSLYGCVADWSAFYQEVLMHLQPGAYLEQVEMGVVPKSDDGTVEPNSIFDQWGKTSLLLGEKFGKTLRVVDEAKGNMEVAGFVDVVEHRRKLSIGGWAAN